MGAIVFWQNAGGNDIATLQATFDVNGTPTDPTVVTCVVTDPTGTSTTHTFGGAAPADITKLSTGKFQLELGATIVGLWSYVWVGTGASSDVLPGTFTVNPTATLSQFYTSVEEVKSRLGISDNLSDFELVTAVQTAAKAVEGWCGRHFYQITEARTYVPVDIYDLPVDDLVSVTQLAVDEDANGTYEDIWVAGTDYQLNISGDFATGYSGEQRPYNHIRALAKQFPPVWPLGRADLVKITGTWGWPAVPFAVKQATVQVAAEIFKLKDAPFGMLGSSEFGIARLPRGGNPYVAQLLCKYISPLRKVGI